MKTQRAKIQRSLRAAVKGVPERAIIGGAYPIEHGLSGIVVTTGKPVVVPDVRSDYNYIQLFPDVCSELAAPLMVGSEVIGVINLESVDLDHFTDEHVQIIQLVTSLLTLAFRSGSSTENESTTRSLRSKTSGTALVAMPFREPFTKYYRAILGPAVEDAGLSAIRSDEMFGPNEIMRDLWGAIRDAKLVLAELTGRNPNVMYEVGLSHGIGKPVILVAQSIDDVPFDLRALRVVLYDTTDPEWAPRLRSAITKSIQAVITNGVSGPYSV